MRKRCRCRCRCRWLSNPHSSWFENGLHAWIISLIWNLSVWFLWNQMKQFLKYDFSANLHYFWCNFFACLLARYVAVGFFNHQFRTYVFFKTIITFESSLHRHNGKARGFAAANTWLLTLFALHPSTCELIKLSLKGLHEKFFFPKDGNAGAGMIRFSNAFLCFVQVASSSEREMVGPKIYCSYQCHRMGKLWHIWKACLVRQKDIYNHCRRYPTFGKARDADLSDKVKRSNLPLYM